MDMDQAKVPQAGSLDSAWLTQAELTALRGFVIETGDLWLRELGTISRLRRANRGLVRRAARARAALLTAEVKTLKAGYTKGQIHGDIRLAQKALDGQR